MTALFFIYYYFFFFQFISTLVLVCVERKSLVNASLRGQKGPFSCWLCSVTIITKNLRNLDIGVGRENKKQKQKKSNRNYKNKVSFFGVMATLCTLVSRNYGVPTRSNWYFYLWEKKKQKKNNHLHLIVVISFFFFTSSKSLFYKLHSISLEIRIFVHFFLFLFWLFIIFSFSIPLFILLLPISYPPLRILPQCLKLMLSKTVLLPPHPFTKSELIALFLAPWTSCLVRIISHYLILDFWYWLLTFIF